MNRKYRYECLHRFARDVFIHEGVPTEEAETAANILMWASVRGVDTHGIRNLKRYYVDGIRNGAIRPACELTVERETASTLAANANSSLGLVAFARSSTTALMLYFPSCNIQRTLW